MRRSTRFSGLFLLFTFLLSITLPSFAMPTEATAKTALVYNGSFASGASDFEGMLTKAGYTVEYFTNVNSLKTKMPSAKVVLFPGTDDNAGSLEDFIQQFEADTIQGLKDFVSRGGRYIGVCGGAYIMSTTYTTAFDSGTGIGLAEFSTEGYSESDEATIIPITWKDTDRTIYYQLGPKMICDEALNSQTIATYEDDSVAACIINVGQGKIFLVGPHPEVLVDNLEESDIPDGTLEDLTDTSDMLTDIMTELG